jgi:hypothetical protein
MELTDVERAISQSFLPALFGDKYDNDNPQHSLACPRPPSSMPAWQYQIPPNPLNPTMRQALWLALHLVLALKGVVKFCSSDHLEVIRSVRIELARLTKMRCMT